MTLAAADRSRLRWGRFAGLMYLLVDAAYALGILIVSRFSVSGDFAATARKITASEHLYRTGLAGGLMAAVGTVLLAMGLYVAVKSVDPDLALLALLCRLVEAALFGASAIVGFAGATLYGGGAAVKGFDAAQLSALLDLRSATVWAAFNVAATFFAVGSILFFLLFFKGRAIPRSLALLGLVGSILVPIATVGTLVVPSAGRMLFRAWIPLGVAEVLTGLWLLIKGVRVAPVAG